MQIAPEVSSQQKNELPDRFITENWQDDTFVSETQVVKNKDFSDLDRVKSSNPQLNANRSSIESRELDFKVINSLVEVAQNRDKSSMSEDEVRKQLFPEQEGRMAADWIQEFELGSINCKDTLHTLPNSNILDELILSQVDSINGFDVLGNSSNAQKPRTNFAQPKETPKINTRSKIDHENETPTVVKTAQDPKTPRKSLPGLVDTGFDLSQIKSDQAEKAEEEEEQIPLGQKRLNFKLIDNRIKSTERSSESSKHKKDETSPKSVNDEFDLLYEDEIKNEKQTKRRKSSRPQKSKAVKKHDSLGEDDFEDADFEVKKPKRKPGRKPKSEVNSTNKNIREIYKGKMYQPKKDEQTVETRNEEEVRKSKRKAKEYDSDGFTINSGDEKITPGNKSKKKAKVVGKEKKSAKNDKNAKIDNDFRDENTAFDFNAFGDDAPMSDHTAEIIQNVEVGKRVTTEKILNEVQLGVPWATEKPMVSSLKGIESATVDDWAKSQKEKQNEPRKKESITPNNSEDQSPDSVKVVKIVEVKVREKEVVKRAVFLY
jgi:hypothetical protein